MGGMKTAPISEMERTAGFLALDSRRDMGQREKMKRLSSHSLLFKLEAPTKSRLLLQLSQNMKRLSSHGLLFKLEASAKKRVKRHSPSYWIKALHQKHKLPPSACKQPLKMLQGYGDWRAETPAIILNISVIQAKE